MSKEQDFERRRAFVEGGHDLCFCLAIALGVAGSIVGVLVVVRRVGNRVAVAAFGLACFALVAAAVFCTAEWGPSNAQSLEEYRSGRATIDLAGFLMVLLFPAALLCGILGVVYGRKHPTAGGLRLSKFGIFVGVLPLTLPILWCLGLMTGVVRVPFAGFK